MKTLLGLFLTAFALSLTGLSPKAQAEDVIDFDTIVDNLEGSTRTPLKGLDGGDPFDDVMIHASVGFVGSYNQIRVPNQSTVSGLLSGVEARFGIDLFSPYWQAQGAIRSFDQAKIDAEISASLKEFDLTILHSGIFNRRLGWHMAGGVAARYLRVTEQNQGELNYTTPSSIVAAGLTANFTDRVGITADLSWRRSFIDETADRTAYQASLALDARF